MDFAAKQEKKQNYDWLKPTQYKPGQSGNPKGRPPGKSLKTWLREYFESLDDNGRKAFFKNIDPEVAWRMAEGNPNTESEVTMTTPIPILDVSNNNSSKENTEAPKEN